MKKIFAVMMAVICLFAMASLSAGAVSSPGSTVKVESSVVKGGGGSITPSASYKPGQSPTYYIVPDKGYKIKQVWINGEAMGAISEFTFSSLEENQTIEVEFEKITETTTKGGTTTGTTVPNTGKTSPNTGAEANYQVIVPATLGVMLIGALTTVVVKKKNQKDN